MKASPQSLTKAEFEPDQMVERLLGLWLMSLSKMTWKERLDLLEAIDDEIGAMCDSVASHQAVSREFTSKLLDLMDGGCITCIEQAYIYLNSDNPVHHNAARAWLVLHQPNNKALSKPELSHGPVIEQRAALRHGVDLPTVIAANDARLSGRLVDISATGAKVAVLNELAKDAVVEIEVPHLGRVAACVVWAAANLVGLTFATEQITSLTQWS